MNHVMHRTLTGMSVGVGVIALFLWCPLRAVGGIVLVLSCLAQLEFYQLAKRYEPVTWFGILAGAAWVLCTGYMDANVLSGPVCFFTPFAFVIAFFVLCTWVLFRQRYANPAGSIASTMLGFFYVPFLLSYFLKVIDLGAAPDAPRIGLYTLFALIATAKFSDTGGFAFGMAFGKHKMCPSISPKKSWEGLAGSMLFSAATACVFLAIARHHGWGAVVNAWNLLTYPLAAAVGALIALLATVGDLIESRFKRACGVKDSATFMPAGMGGFLDMFDSILFIPALLYFPLFYLNVYS